MGYFLADDVRNPVMDSRKDGNRQRQAYAHNNVAAKGCCQVGGEIERYTVLHNPIRLYVWTTYGNARNVHKPFMPLRYGNVSIRPVRCTERKSALICWEIVIRSGLEIRVLTRRV